MTSEPRTPAPQASPPAPRDREIAHAFDEQAEAFERSPVPSDPAALALLVERANLPAGSLVLDAGCGPGLVSLALLEAGHRVVGVDLSSEMIRRARARCASFGERARFERASIHEPLPAAPFDAAISRYVIHHVDDPLLFVMRQVELVRPGGILVACDQTTDPNPERARWHQEIERGRDRTHVRHLTLGELADLFASAGLENLRLDEERFDLDFDEWFDRGSPSAEKKIVRSMLLSGERARGLEPAALEGGAIRMACWRATVRGVKPL